MHLHTKLWAEEIKHVIASPQHINTRGLWCLVNLQIVYNSWINVWATLSLNFPISSYGEKMPRKSKKVVNKHREWNILLRVRGIEWRNWGSFAIFNPEHFPPFICIHLCWLKNPLRKRLYFGAERTFRKRSLDFSAYSYAYLQAYIPWGIRYCTRI